MKRIYVSVAFFMMVLLMAGCSPTYVRPPLPGPVPVAYKEDGDWRTAMPQDSLDRGNWWERFQDPILSDLIQKANSSNQNIAVAAANFRQARTQITTARSAFLPGVSLPGGVTRSGGSSGGASTQYSVGVNAAWEVSLWNALPAFEAAKAETEASGAEYATMRLAVQAELAQAYFQLRMLDSQMFLYDSTIATYAKAVQLTRSQYRGGLATPSDVAQAEAQRASAEADLAALARQRSELEHGIAVLLGQIPSSFTLPPQKLQATLPSVPLALPSALLERRPDIASAERHVMSANEQIGVARGAWFPTLSLGGSGTSQRSAWHSAPISFWSLGPSLALDLFDGGKKLAANEAAWAQYEATVASYRQTVLTGVKEVEDNLSALRLLEAEAEARNRAVSASQTALRLSLSQYRNGMTTYLQVVSSQTASLTSERSAIQVEAQQLITSVNLIKALGGGWDPASLDSMRKGDLVPQEGVLPRE